MGQFPKFLIGGEPRGTLKGSLGGDVLPRPLNPDPV